MDQQDTEETELMFEGDLETVFVPSSEGSAEVEVGHQEVGEHDHGTDAAVASIQMEGDIITEEHIQEHEFLMTDPSLLPQPAENAPDVEISFEDQLKSTEKLDRSSPDLWPQNLPTTAKQILYNNQLKTGEHDPPGGWAQGLDPEDINLLHQFGSLTSSSLVEEVKKLQNIAYQLGLDEKKEMTRGKLLHVLDEGSSLPKDKTLGHGKDIWK